MSWPKYSDDEISKVSEVLSSGKVNYWTGMEGKLFEKEFAEWSGNKFAIALSNGTAALELILRGLKIGPHEEVIVTSRSFIASCSCVVNVGAIPVFADIEANYGNICPHSIKSKISLKTKAIICVHLGGAPCDMTEIIRIADENNLYVIEDCAQAHGAYYKGSPVGSFGHASAWSFCQDKIISTGGEGGMVATNDQELWLRMWSYKDHGKDYYRIRDAKKNTGFQWVHNSIGTNWRMTEMQAAIGRIQLRKVDAWVEARNKNAEIILKKCSAHGAFKIPKKNQDVKHAYYRCYLGLDYTKLKTGWDKRKIVDSLFDMGVSCFDGSCSEIYKEKAFKSFETYGEGRLINAEYFSKSSFCFLVDQTIASSQIKTWFNAIDLIMAKASIVK